MIMNIRKSITEDLNAILDIFEYARNQMRLNGNPKQWGINRPSVEIIKKDIEDKNSYVIEKDNQICGVFTFIVGKEPNYQTIKNGKWLNDDKYGTVHRIASNGKEKGILNACLSFCEDKIDNIRIDTHDDNKIMQHLLEKSGYKKCGIIYVEDKTPRIAYQKVVK